MFKVLWCFMCDQTSLFEGLNSMVDAFMAAVCHMNLKSLLNHDVISDFWCSRWQQAKQQCWLKIAEIPMVENIFRQNMLGYPRLREKTRGKTTRLEENRNMRVSHEIEFSSNAKSFHAILWHPLTKGKHEPWKLRLENWVPRKHTPKSSGHDEPLMRPSQTCQELGVSPIFVNADSSHPAIRGKDSKMASLSKMFPSGLRPASEPVSDSGPITDMFFRMMYSYHLSFA